MRTIELLLQTLEYLNTTRIFDTRHDYYWYDSQQSRFHCDYGTLSSADDVNDIPDECKWGANRCCAVHVDSLSLEGVDRRKADRELCLCLLRVEKMHPDVPCDTYRYCRDGRAYAAGFRDYDDDKKALVKPWWATEIASEFVRVRIMIYYGDVGLKYYKQLVEGCPSIKNIIKASCEELATCLNVYKNVVDCDPLWKEFLLNIVDPTNDTKCMEVRKNTVQVMQLEDWVPRGTTPMTPNITEQEDTNTTTGGTFAISGEIYGLIIPLIIAIATISIICSNLYLGLTRDSPPKKKTPKPVKEKSKTSKAASAPKTTSAESKSKEAMTKSPETTTKSKESAEKLGSAESGTSKSAESIHKMKP